MLVHDARLLDEVVVKSRLPKTRIQGDAFVTTVEGTLLAEAGSAGDVLEHIPAVTRKDENFEVFGKGMPTIYINGRQVRDVDELERLNSSDIRRVELVTNPGARYDASVKSVIRIRTRRQKGDGFGFDLRSTYTYADRSQWHEQANLNYRHDGLDVFGKLTFRDTYHVQESRIAQTTHSGSVWQQVNDMTITNRNRRIDAETGLNYVSPRTTQPVCATAYRRLPMPGHMHRQAAMSGKTMPFTTGGSRKCVTKETTARLTA